MTDEATTVTLPDDDPTAVALLTAVRGGDVDLVRRLHSENPDLAGARFGSSRGGTRTALHFVTDWPGYFPNGPDIVTLLIDAGADPNALTTGRDSATPGPGSETPLHWAASSDDVDVAVALIDGGADLETPDGSIGTPLDNAVGHSCWNVARVAPESRRSGTPPPSACWTDWTTCSCLRSIQGRSHRGSGTRALPVNAVPPNVCFARALISTGSRTTHKAQQWMRPRVSGLSGKT
jgi:hypothetical protein